MACKNCGRKIGWSGRQQLKVIRKILKRHHKTSTTLPKIKGLCPVCAKDVMKKDLSELMKKSKDKDIPLTVREMADKTLAGEVPKMGKVKKELKRIKDKVEGELK